MAVTITVRKRITAGNARRVIADITGPASYTAGGETLTLAQLQALLCESPPASNDWTLIKQFDTEADTSGRLLVLDKSNGKVKFQVGGQIVKLTASLTPAAVGANTTAEQSFAVTGAAAGDVVLGVSKPTAQAGLGIVGQRSVSATNYGITFSNNTGAGITPTAAETYSFLVYRAGTGAEVPAGTDLSAVTVRGEFVYGSAFGE